MKRRKFITESKRWFMLGGMLGVSGLLVYRRRFGNPETCFTNPFCNTCGQFGSCDKIASSKPVENEKKGRK